MPSYKNNIDFEYLLLLEEQLKINNLLSAGSELEQKTLPCWEGYVQIGMKKKKGKLVPNCVPIEQKTAKLKNPEGGLTAAGRRFFKNRDGSNLKPGVKGPADTPIKMRRKGSFLTRFFTNPSGPMKDEKGRPTRLALSASAWGEPVPQDATDAAALAAKGRRMLERYGNTKKKKDAWLESEEKMLGPTIGGSSQQDAARDQDDDGVINDGTPNEKPTPKNSDRAEDLRNSRKYPYKPGFILPDDGGNLQQYSGEPPKDKPYFKEHRNGSLYEFRPNRPPRKSRTLGNDEII